AKNRDLEADAVEIRMRATRRLDQLRQAQKQTVGLNQGAVPGKTGLRGNPVLDPRPTLASQGIDKNLAHQARVLGALSEQQFDQTLADARDGITRAVKKVVAAAAAEVNVADEDGTTIDQTAEVVTLKTHTGQEVPYRLPKGPATFNQTNEQVSWARFT